MTHLSAVVGLLLAGLLVSGCVSAPVERARALVPAVEADIGRAADKIALARPSSLNVRRHLGQRLLGDQIGAKDVDPRIGELLSQKMLYTSNALSLREVAEDLSQRLGVRIRLAGVFQHGGSSAVSASNEAFPVSHDGSLAELLDRMAERFGASYRYSPDSRALDFFVTEARTYHVSLARGKGEISSAIALGGAGGGGGASGGGASGGGGGGGGSGGAPVGAANVSVSSDASIDQYSSLVSMIEMLVARHGGRAGGAPAGGRASGQSSGGAVGQSQSGSVIANRDLGMITVVATPAAHEEIAPLVAALNERFTRQVYAVVRVLRVSSTEGGVSSISFDAKVRDALAASSVDIAGGGVPGASSGTPGRVDLKLSGAGGRNRVDIFIRALQSVGHVTQVTSGTVVARNGQPAPIQVATDLAYFTSPQTSLVPNAGSQSSFAKETIRVGLTGNFVPLILDDNRIQVDLSLSISSGSIQEFPVQNSSARVGLPTVQSVSVMQTTVVRDGDALVNMGYEETRSSTDSTTGITSVGASGSTDRSKIIIITEVFSART